MVDSPQELLYCRVVTPFKGQTQFKVNGSYPLPGQFVVSGTYQNLPGVPYEANYNVTSAEVAPSLGRPLAGGTRTVLVPLVAMPVSGVSTGETMALMEQLVARTLPPGTGYEWTAMSYQEEIVGGQMFVVFGLALLPSRNTTSPEGLRARSARSARESTQSRCSSTVPLAPTETEWAMVSNR